MFGKDRWEGVQSIYIGTQLRGYAWVESDRAWDREQLLIVVRGTLIFGIVWIFASTVLVWFLSRSISRPLAHSSRRDERPDDLAGKHGELPAAHDRRQRIRRPDRGLQPHGGVHRGAAIRTERHAVSARLDAGQCAHRAGLLRPPLPLRAGEPRVCGIDRVSRPAGTWEKRSPNFCPSPPEKSSRMRWAGFRQRRRRSANWRSKASAANRGAPGPGW